MLSVNIDRKSLINAYPILRKGYRHFAMVFALVFLTYVSVGCALLRPPTNPETGLVENRPSEVETTLGAVSETVNTVVAPATSTTPIAPITTGIGMVLALAYATVKHYRENKYREVLVSVEKQSTHGILTMLSPDTPTNTKKFAEKVVGQS